MRPDHLQTLPRGGADALLAEHYRSALAEARERTLALVAPVTEENLDLQHHPLMSPLVWDLGHIAAFEDLWLGQRAGGLQALRPDLAEVYDAAETPRAQRGAAPYLRREHVLDFMAAVRGRALEVLDRSDLSPGGDPLHAHGFVWEMIVQHEHQHNETMLQTLQLVGPGVYSPPRRGLPWAAEQAGPATVRVSGGPFPMGDPGAGFAYDNERPRRDVDVAAFEIDRLPVTNGAYLEFVDDGGYARQELWGAEGWRWRCADGVERPLYWDAEGNERRFERVAEIDPLMGVMHVSWHEADAFARWRGARLPTEAEWEKAAAYDPEAGESRRQPWGDEDAGPQRANVDQLAFGPAPAGALPAGAAPCGALGMIGDAWEWTASAFGGYPGFRAHPYPEYSEAFFGGGYRVLRGGSWASRPSVVRATFRNWDHPQRRQVFTGFRCAQ